MSPLSGLFGPGIAILTVLIGVLLFWYGKVRARRRLAIDSFATFFLGGGQIGEYLTANNNWGICFAFANALWYYAFLGYYYGIYIFLLQLAWSAAVVFLAKHIVKYLGASSDGTIHGFISHHYGIRTSLLAAVATIIGYTLNIGFELFYSAHLLVASIGAPRYELGVAVLLALFVGGYCVIGGYMSSVATDPLQNGLGVVSLIILLALVLPSVAHGPAMRALFSRPNTAYPGTSFIVGVVVFSFFFNLVDMANWQSIAANRGLSSDKVRDVAVGLYQSAAIQMLAPAALGTLFGATLRLTKPGIPDDGYFGAVIRPLLMPSRPWGGVLLGVLFLGFIGIAVSSAGSYLLAAMQTLSIDLFKRQSMAVINGRDLNEAERKEIEQSVLDWVKRWMIPVVVGMTLLFAAPYNGLSRIDRQGLAFQFQFVMYGAAVTLVPTVMFALFRPPKRRLPRAGFWSICVGLICVIVPFGLAETLWSYIPMISHLLTSDDVVNLTPLFGVLSSFVVFMAIAKWETHDAR